MKAVDWIVVMLAGVVVLGLVTSIIPTITRGTEMTDVKAMILGGLCDSSIAIIAFYVGTKSKGG